MVSSAEAKAFLISRFGHDVGEAALVGRGEWSHAYAFRHGGSDFIIRFSALDEDFHKDRLADRHGSAALPIPAITEIGESRDGYYAISERAAGDPLDDLDEARMRLVLPALFAALDAARQVDLSGSTGYGSWGADGNAPHPSWRAALLDIANDRQGERTHGWRALLAASPTGSAPFEEAYDRLRILTAVCPEERHLIHGDLLNFNVLVAGDRLNAVIDWGCAMYGDFLYDLAWFLYWAPWYPAWSDIGFQDEALRHYAAIGLDVPDFAERLACYYVHIGLADQAYSAFKQRWERVADAAERTLAMARNDP